METPHNQDLFIIHLADSLALPGSKKYRVNHLYLFPPLLLRFLHVRGVECYPLNCVKVLFGLVRYTAEYVDAIVIEGAT